MNQIDLYHNVIRNIYSKYCPENIGDISRIFDEQTGTEKIFIDELL